MQLNNTKRIMLLRFTLVIILVHLFLFSCQFKEKHSRYIGHSQTFSKKVGLTPYYQSIDLGIPKDSVFIDKLKLSVKSRFQGKINLDRSNLWVVRCPCDTTVINGDWYENSISISFKADEAKISDSVTFSATYFFTTK